MNTDFEHIAGFPPYIRGYHTMGHLLNFPLPSPILIYQDENTEKFKIDTNIEIIFKKEADFLKTNLKNKSFLIENSNYQSFSGKLQELNNIYIASNFFLDEKGKKFFKELIHNPDFYQKIKIFFNFSDDIFAGIEIIRQIRVQCSLFVENDIYKSLLPIACHISNISEQLYALSSQVDILLYTLDNQHINDITNTFIIDNSKITKTIDPFFDSSFGCVVKSMIL